MSTSIVYNSMDWSIYAQVITGALGFAGLGIKLEDEHRILKRALELELVVQVIELAFYIFLLRKMAVGNMAGARYFDWVITTPVMLFTTIVYLKYEEHIEKSRTEELKGMTLGSFWDENKEVTKQILIYNFLMILFGYLGETGVIGITEAFVLGTAAFLMSFWLIYDKFARHSLIGKRLFSIMFVVWSIYGIGFLLDANVKNTLFNGLDVVAKNFFGVFLFYKINSVRAMRA